MNLDYICFCGLYCENCALRAKINPAARRLYDEMMEAGFEEIISFIPGGDGFWPFLRDMAEHGACTSCKGDGGNPDCAVRICARNRGAEVCALCEDYPCDRFEGLLEGYPVLGQDNALLKEKGWDEWAELQDKRRKGGYTYTGAAGAEK